MIRPVWTARGAAEHALGLVSRVGLPAPACPVSEDAFSFAVLKKKALPIEAIKAPQSRAMFHALYRWAGIGMPMMAPTLPLAAALLLTDPSKVEAWNPPFGSFAIHLPYDLLQAGDRRCPMVFFHRCTTGATESGEIDITRAAMSPQKVRNWILLPYSDYMLHSVRHEQGDRTVGEWLEVPKEGRSDLWPSEVALGEGDDATMMSAWRLVINLSIYLAEKGRDHIRKKRDGRPIRRSTPVGLPDRPEVWVIGRTVKLSDELIASARSCCSARWKVNSRFTVRGHWRNQPVGVGRSEVRRQWIGPYWKGPEDGVRLAHLYKDESCE